MLPLVSRLLIATTLCLAVSAATWMDGCQEKRVERIVPYWERDIHTLSLDELTALLEDIHASGVHLRAWNFDVPPGMEEVTEAEVRDDPVPPGQPGNRVDVFIGHNRLTFDGLAEYSGGLRDRGYLVIQSTMMLSGLARTYDEYRAGVPEIPMDHFRGMAYLFGRAMARELGPLTDVFQIDTEVNVMGLYFLFGWAGDPSWADWGRVRAYVEAIHEGIKEERPGAVTAVEVQATVIRELLDEPITIGQVTFDFSWLPFDLVQDVAFLVTEGILRNLLIPQMAERYPAILERWSEEEIVEFLLRYLETRPPAPGGGTGRFEDELRDLGNIADRITCTIHPHYIDPEHIRGGVMGLHPEIVGDLVTRIRRALPGKKVMVQVGYPSGPTALGFSQAGQAEFAEGALASGYEAGVDLYSHLSLYSSSEPIDPPLGEPFVVEQFWAMFVGGERKPSADVVREYFMTWENVIK